MDLTMFKRRRRTVILATLVSALLALPLGVAMGAFSQSAQAKTRHHARHAVRRVHARSANSSTTADSESGAGTVSDGPGGPDVQSGSQSGPNDTTGPDTETTGSEGGSSTGNDPAGGSNCVDNAGCQ